jgi:IclR family pca regulon transcriptional regulator
VLDEELEVGLRSIAVPVRNRRGEVIAALNVGAPTARASVDRLLSEVLPQLRIGAEQIGLYAEL